MDAPQTAASESAPEHTCQSCLDLRAEIARLSAQLASRESKLGFLERHPTIGQGIRGETLVVFLTKLPATERNAPFDVGHESLRIEVKLSALGSNTKGAIPSRWTWGRIFGSGEAKRYEQLLLIGEKDPRYIDRYLDPANPYIMFDLPYSIAESIAARAGKAGRVIHLSSNPETASRKNKELFEKYQVTEADIIEKYGI